eukprot:PLAT6600.1.p1 GENE.PLAT6600.1~~PLAT6600.1.p1  ORF type:complete len:659 (-),score=383.51 PLAT6600.1:61-2037(-)
MTLEYDNSAFYYFGLVMLGLYLVPVTALTGCALWKRTAGAASRRARSEEERRKKQQLEAQRPLWTKPFICNVVILVLFWICFLYLLSLVWNDSEIATFDPFAILGLETDATDKEIRRAYRKLSLLYHPDRNPDAKDKFLLIAKAHSALTDEVAKENMRRYGNPDGRQALEVSFGLPKILADSNFRLPVLTVYFIVLLIVIPVSVYKWYSNSRQYGEKDVMHNSYQWFAYCARDNLTRRVVPEILAGAEEFRKLSKLTLAEAEEVKTLVTRLRKPRALGKKKSDLEGVMPRKNKFSENLAIKGAVTVYMSLLHAHMCRLDMSPTLQLRVTDVLKKCPSLVEAMIKVAAQRGANVLLMTFMIELGQSLAQALPSGASPFLQLPHFSKREVSEAEGKKRSRTLAAYLAMPAEERPPTKSLAASEEAELAAVLAQMPNMQFAVKAEVKDEEEIAVGDLMTFTVSMTRLHVAEGAEAPLAYAPHFPGPRLERWWVIVHEAGSPRASALDIVDDESREVQAELKLPAPRKPGTYTYTVLIKCEVYAGLDQQLSVTFDVLPADALPKYEPHPEDLELDNEPSLMEQLMGATAEEDSSDDEDDSDAEPLAVPKTAAKGDGLTDKQRAKREKRLKRASEKMAAAASEGDADAAAEAADPADDSSDEE